MMWLTALNALQLELRCHSCIHTAFQIEPHTYSHIYPTHVPHTCDTAPYRSSVVDAKGCQSFLLGENAMP